MTESILHPDFDDERDESDYWPDDDDDKDEWVLDCGMKDCCMPGYHFRSECYTPEMYESSVRAAERGGKRCPDGDWAGDREPGGMECEDCGCIFISNEGRSFCKVCSDAHSAVRRSGDA